MEAPPASDALTLKVAFDRKERIGAMRAANMLGPRWRRPIVMLPVIAVGAGLVGWAQTALQRSVHWGGISVVGEVVLVAVSVGSFIYGIRFLRRINRENARHEAHPDTYTLNDAGLEISGVDDLTLMSWSHMTRVHETDRFFLFVTGSEVQYLPKRALDAAQVDVVRGLVLRRGPPAGLALPALTGGAELSPVQRERMVSRNGRR